MESAIISSIREGPWETEPYQYRFLENVFDDSLYAEMLKRLPEDSEYKMYSKRYPNRFIYNGKDTFWANILNYKNGKKKVKIKLCRDFPGYSIGPHTDGPKEKITALLYLTDHEIPGAGTSLYVPKVEGFTHDGSEHLDVKDFTKVNQANFSPNSGFVFVRSDNSFHGVEPVDAVRNLIQVSIFR